jgi:hypothetical protein
MNSNKVSRSSPRDDRVERCLYTVGFLPMMTGYCYSSSEMASKTPENSIVAFVAERGALL